MQNEQLVKEKRDKFVRRAYGILRNIYSPNSNLTDKQREHLKDVFYNEVWSSANDPYDFDLKTYITRGKLKWIDLTEERMPIYPIGDEECPFLTLDGRRLNQIIVKRYVDYFGLPNGEPICPFGD
jgi:hypothetical protein